MDDIIRSLHIQALLNLRYYFIFFDSVIYSILYVIQIIWYEHIFIHQLQQYKNKIVVQFSSYSGHIYGCLGCDRAADHMITKIADFSIPSFLCHIHVHGIV